MGRPRDRALLRHGGAGARRRCRRASRRRRRSATTRSRRARIHTYLVPARRACRGIPRQRHSRCRASGTANGTRAVAMGSPEKSRPARNPTWKPPLAGAFAVHRIGRLGASRYRWTSHREPHVDASRHRNQRGNPYAMFADGKRAEHGVPAVGSGESRRSAIDVERHVSTRNGRARPGLPRPTAVTQMYPSQAAAMAPPRKVVGRPLTIKGRA